jgi:hypothetical protein
LTLNASKTKAMLFGSYQKLSRADPLSVTIRNIPLETVDSFKYLGLHFDSTLSWNNHVDHITKSVVKYIGLFYRIRKYLSKESLTILHNSLILPRIDYCDVVWGNCNINLQNRIERLQVRSARAILRVPIRTSSDFLRTKMGWEILKKRRDYHVSIAVYKCITGLAPASMCNHFTLVGDSHSHKTRSNTFGKIRPMRPARESGRRSFQYRGALNWNKLNNSITRSLPITVNGFKSQFQLHKVK